MKDPQFSTNQQRQHSNCTKQLPPSQKQIQTRENPNNNYSSRTTNYQNKNARKLTNKSGLRNIQNENGT